VGGVAARAGLVVRPRHPRGSGVGLLGALVEVVLLRRVCRARELYQLLLTFALVLVAADAVRLVWGADNKTGPEPPGLAGSIRVLGQLFPTYDLAMIAAGKGSVFPVYVDVTMSVQPIVMVLLGGVGTFAGPALGAVAYKLLDTLITGYTAYWQLVLGAILIALVILFPRGIAGTFGKRS